LYHRRSGLSSTIITIITITTITTITITNNSRRVGEHLRLPSQKVQAEQD
jgi:hypothetical protein